MSDMAVARQIGVQTSADTLRPGEIFELQIDFDEARRYDSVIYPDSTLFGNQFFIRNKELSRRGRRATYDLQFFGAAETNLSELHIQAVRNSDTLRYAVPSVSFEFQTVLAPQDNLRPMKPLFEFPYGIQGLIIAFLLAMLAAFSAWHLYQRYFKKPPPPPEPVREEAPPFDSPLKRLEKGINELEAGFKDESMDAETLYLRLSYIIREYYERVYAFPALEQTSTEVLQSLKHRKVMQTHYDTISGLLMTSDMVKFAGFIPEKSDTAQDLATLREACTQLRKMNAGLIQQMELEHLRRYRTNESVTKEAVPA
ncbi:hypothetical protein [Cyclonatronum proteinivorum]|nr:hypothetical protein [Cyclonatronum proteinivorum]